MSLGIKIHVKKNKKPSQSV